MALYCGINGVKRKITKLYAGINGETRELATLWTNSNGELKKIFENSRTAKLSLIFSTDLSNPNRSGRIDLTAGHQYELWLIGIGGRGGNGGDSWGVYHGGGGGAGGTGGYAHVKFIAASNSKLSWSTSSQSSGVATDVHIIVNGVEEITLSTRANGIDGSNGEDAGAFVITPDGGACGSAGTANLVIASTHLTNVLEFNFSNGTSAGSSAGNRYGQGAPSPVSTPYTAPSYVASAGQNAYYSLDLASLCLGNAGGGGNEKSNGGIGAPGGLICIET